VEIFDSHPKPLTAFALKATWNNTETQAAEFGLAVTLRKQSMIGCGWMKAVRDKNCGFLLLFTCVSHQVEASCLLCPFPEKEEIRLCSNLKLQIFWGKKQCENNNISLPSSVLSPFCFSLSSLQLDIHH